MGHLSGVTFPCSFPGMHIAQWIGSASRGKGEVTPHKIPLSPLSSRPQMAVSPPMLFNDDGCRSLIQLYSCSAELVPVEALPQEKQKTLLQKNITEHFWTRAASAK